MPLDPKDPFFEGTIRNIIKEEIGTLPVLVRQLQSGQKIYTTATRPAAASSTGRIIYVSDGAAGSKFQGSDGSSWVSLG